MSATALTQTDIEAGLRGAGIQPGDTLMVHSSLKSLGAVDGGAETVIDALLSVVGPGGHLVMPTLTATFAHSGGKDAGLAFNPQTTPSRVGLITERFWRRANAVRSAHPTHSLACIGPQAQAWMAGHADITTFDWNGPYGKYVHAGGAPSKLIFLGVDLICNTTYHAVEEWLGLPYMASATALVEREGKVVEVQVRQAPLGPRGFYSRRDRLHRLMEETGRIQEIRIGEARVQVLDTRFCVAESIRLELAHPGIFLTTNPESRFCAEGRAQIMSIQNEIRARAEQIRARGLCE